MELKINGTPEEIADVLRRLSAPAPKAKTKKRAKKRASDHVNETGAPPLTFTFDPGFVFDPNAPSMIPTIWYPPTDSSASPVPPTWTFTEVRSDDLYRNTPYEHATTSHVPLSSVINPEVLAGVVEQFGHMQPTVCAR